MNVSTVSISRRLIFIIGLLMAILAGFFSLTRQAAMQSEAAPVFDSTAAQPDALGKLAFERLNFFTGGSANTSLLAVNADGTNLMTLAAAGTPPLFCGEPAWSPDGTKIVYVQDFDIFVMNADGSNKINITNNGVMGERNPSWSAANKIAYERESQIWTMNADGSNQTRFSAITQPSPLAPAWSPDGAKLAFTSGGEIYVINADGTNERRVTNNSTADADPAWSPDGAKIVFGKGGVGIAVINLDGTGEANLTNGANDGKPSWSSDATKIAFVRPGSGIFTMDASGANQIRIVADQPSQPGRNQNDNPAWQPVAAAPNTFTISGRVTRGSAGLSGITINLSGTATATATTDAIGNYQFGNLAQGGSYTITPVSANNVFTPLRRIFANLNAAQTADFNATETCSTPNCRTNGRIVFTRDRNIRSANADGTDDVFLTGSADDPAYSSDGSRIAFSTDRDGNKEIYVMNADGSNQTRLTTNAAADTYPVFSPDGARIAFVSNRDGNEEIYTMNADGSNPVRLTDYPGSDIDPSYSPDGSRLVFTRDVFLYTMNAANGGNLVQLTTTPSSFKPSFSPDGTKIVFLRINGSWEIFLMNADGSNQTSLVNLDPSVRVKPSFSPDGTKIIYSNYVLLYYRNEIKAITPGGGSPVTLIADGVEADWQPLRPATRRTPFDFDGDGRADISLFRPSNGVWYLLPSQGGGFYGFPFGQAGDRVAPADYDGDGKTDVAVFRDSVSGASNAAYFYILNSANNSFRAEQFGATGDVPFSGDWDGDGKGDLAVYRAAGAAGGAGYFYYRPSGQINLNLVALPLGTQGDKPLAADFDGDGRLDPAVFRPANATWYILQSSVNQITQTTFGLPTDIPVPADFDGDGKANIAVFRPSNGTWYTSPNPATNFGAIQFGANGDLPVAADYDGDGRADAAVFRPSNGAWFLNRTTSGLAGVSFGASGDKPAPNAFVP